MLSIILFIICFCLASVALYEPEAGLPTKVTNVENFENFYSAVKEVFTSEFSEAEVPQPLPTPETDDRPITETIVKPASDLPADLTTPQFTIRQLRDYVRQHSLQTTIKEQLGKSVNSCCKEELLSVLSV
jgi:hypothetical protein